MRTPAAGLTVCLLLLAGCSAAPTGRADGALRVMALDQCADQYVLALGEGHDLSLSPRADDPDSYLRAEAAGHRKVRPTLEAVVARAPDVVVRYWGGDAHLLAALEKRGINVVTIADARDYATVEDNIARVAEALNREAEGKALISDMRGTLARGAPGAGHAPVSALYLTSGGFTTGGGTLVDATLKAAGLENAADHAGYGPVRVERLAMNPPERFVLGFYDQVRADRRGAGRHPLVQGLVEARPHTRLPAAVLPCPAWFMADAVPALAALREAS